MEEAVVKEYIIMFQNNIYIVFMYSPIYIYIVYFYILTTKSFNPLSPAVFG